MTESAFAPDELMFANELHKEGFTRSEAMEILAAYVSSWRMAPGEEDE